MKDFVKQNALLHALALTNKSEDKVRKIHEKTKQRNSIREETCAGGRGRSHRCKKSDMRDQRLIKYTQYMTYANKYK